ncbi:hypothetical protein FH972_025584 [Carpinus fangiana]|uniref:Uncharacterized protein n=1 Tax=Carpinus fangiana TaxID=176857 RepID=A0A5N6L1V4_9ROSI|nr:hypothetical protein FH972_025584 [Carpinus fangiana]
MTSYETLLHDALASMARALIYLAARNYFTVGSRAEGWTHDVSASPAEYRVYFVALRPMSLDHETFREEKTEGTYPRHARFRGSNFLDV